MDEEVCSIPCSLGSHPGSHHSPGEAFPSVWVFCWVPKGLENPSGRCSSLMPPLSHLKEGFCIHMQVSGLCKSPLWDLDPGWQLC